MISEPLVLCLPWVRDKPIVGGELLQLQGTRGVDACGPGRGGQRMLCRTHAVGGTPRMRVHPNFRHSLEMDADVSGVILSSIRQ